MKENTRGLVRVARGFLGNRALYPLVLQKPLAVCEVVIKKWLPFKSCCNSIMVEVCPNGYIHAPGRYTLAFSQRDPHNFSHSFIHPSIQVGVSVAVRQFATCSSDSSYEWSLYWVACFGLSHQPPFVATSKIRVSWGMHKTGLGAIR